MKIFNNIFFRKKILIYGLGKSGLSSYNFLKNKSDVYLFDDNQKIKLKYKKKMTRQQAEENEKIYSEEEDVDNNRASYVGVVDDDYEGVIY